MPVSLLSLQDFPDVPEAPEQGATFAEIAHAKAQFYYQHLQLPVLAEDSGLIVPALNGYPGIFSARIAETDAGRIQTILDKLSEQNDRRAFYHCSMVFLSDDAVMESTGRCDGRITEEPRGTHGFGYDPIFLPEALSKTFAELTIDEKAEYSHRGRALKSLLPDLRVWAENHS